LIINVYVWFFYSADNLDEMVDGIKIIAALTEDPRKGDDLLDAAKKLCKAFSDLLDAAKPGEAVGVIFPDHFESMSHLSINLFSCPDSRDRRF
jgi:hypothetical protein